MIAVLGIAAAILLFLSIIGGVMAALKHFQVRQFQDLLFKAERKIDSLERRMFDVLNAVPVALVETDNTGKFTFANKAAHLLLGRKDSELIGLRFHSATWGIVYPDGRMVPPDLMPIARTLRGQTVKGFQHMLTNHGSHDKVLVSVTSMPIVSRAGEVTGASAALVELETQAGQGVDDLTGLWRGQWFATATVPFWGLDAEGRILDVNNAALEAFGLRREDALSKNWTQAFVSDADFRAAMDYLAEALNGEPHGHKSVTVTLKDRDGEERKTVVTAWMVRTHEGGDRGLTVMAMPAVGNDAVGAEAAPESVIAPVAPVMSDDERQELLDLRTAEVARAALGVGVWQYDAEVDTIVEDEGMQRLIGREEPGGPTLISEAGQAAADVAFARLLAGESDALDLDIEVVHKDGSAHWITLKGQATQVDGIRRIFGVAIDTTPWKTEIPVVEVAPQTTEIFTGVSPDDHAAALKAAVAQAHEEAREEARAESQAEARREALAEADAALEAAVEAARAQARREGREEALAEVAATGATDVYSWSTPVPAEPAVVHDPDAAQINETMATENLVLKAQVDALTAELDKVQARAADAAALEAQIRALQAELDHTRIVVADVDTFKSHAAALQDELEEIRAAGAEADTLRLQLLNLQAELTLAQVAAPQAVAEADALRDHLATIEAELTRLQAEHGDLSRELESLHNAPAPEPQIIEREVYITQPDPAVVADNAALRGQLQRAQASLSQVTGDFERSEALRNELQIQLNEIFLTPQPVPDTSEHEARIAELEAQLAAAHQSHAQLEAQLLGIHGARSQLEAQLADAGDTHARLAAQLAAALDARSQLETQLADVGDSHGQLEARLAAAHDARSQLEAQLADVGDSHGQLQARLAAALDAQSRLEAELAAAHDAHGHAQAELGAVAARHGETETALTDAAGRAAQLQAALDALRADREALQARYDDLAARPEPQPDYSEHNTKIAGLQFELLKWQAAYQDAQTRLEAAQEAINNTPPPAPTVDISALTSRLEQLQNTVNLSHEQQAQLQQRLTEMNAALAHAQRFETVGRLTTDVAADFAQMLNVINGALETMSRTPDSPDSVRRLSEAALAAGKRGERLTRQLQAFHTEDY